MPLIDLPHPYAPQPLGLLSQIGLIWGHGLFVARLCLLPSSPSYQVIRLILISGPLACLWRVGDRGFKADRSSRRAWGWVLLLGLCFFSARTAVG